MTGVCSLKSSTDSLNMVMTGSGMPSGPGRLDILCTSL